MKRNILTFEEALRRNAPTAFSTLVKPAGSACNLRCRYCYYLDKSRLYDNRQPVMSEELLETYIRQYIEANEVPEVTFIWHGGEPLLLGKDYYEKALALQRRYADGKRIENVLQTNGTLLTEDWCRFFAANGFLVGVSVDGPEDIHDAFRQNRDGGVTFRRVEEGIALLQRFGVEYNTLSVVSRASEERGREVYRFLKSLGSRYIQFLPAVEHIREEGGRPVVVPPGTSGSRAAEWSVSATGYGKFLNDVFDEWVTADVGTCFVQMFDATLAGWCGVRPGVCSMAETCGDALAVEHNGDVYSCDHFVYPEYRLGNIREDTLKNMYRSSRQFAFGLEKRNSLPAECLRCRYYFACRGGCPKHRFERNGDGGKHKNALCEGFRMFFAHAEPYMEYMRELLAQGQPPAFVRPWARRRMGLDGIVEN